jgi:hypothetical protein
MNDVMNKLEKMKRTFNDLGFKTPEELRAFVDRDPDLAVKDLNKRIDRMQVRAEKVGSAEKTPDAPHTISEAQKKWYREDVLGKTPSKDSATGRIVQDRMRSQGKLKTENGQDVFQDRRTQKWYPVNSSDIHMGHTKDAVTWWNEKGRYYAPKSPEVRDWMENPKHYELEYGPENSSAGAQIGEEYLPPIEDPIDKTNWPRPLREDE